MDCGGIEKTLVRGAQVPLPFSTAKLRDLDTRATLGLKKSKAGTDGKTTQDGRPTKLGALVWEGDDFNKGPKDCGRGRRERGNAPNDAGHVLCAPPGQASGRSDHHLAKLDQPGQR